MVSRRLADPLCLCEYYDKKGERSHILACCCNCEALDTCCDRLLTCRGVDPDVYDEMCQTFADRLRLPSIFGQGAVKVHPDVAIPLVLVPTGLLMATINEYFTFLFLVGLPMSILLYFYMWNRRKVKERTRVFYVWGLTSTGTLISVFLFVVIEFRKIFLWEIMVEVTLFGILMYYLYEIRKGPGVITRSEKSYQSSNTRQNRGNVDDEPREIPEDPLGNLLVQNFGYDKQDIKDEIMLELERRDELVLHDHQVTWVDSRPFRGGRLVTWCDTCKVRKVGRSGHCSVCNVCVYGRDHHCVWVDSCIGAANHRAFLLGLFFLELTGLYGAHLTLTTVCTPTMYLDWFLLPANCYYVYADLPTALSFVAACYTVTFCAFMLLVLIQQSIYISQNITSQEMHHASQRGWSGCGCYAQQNVNNHGVLNNWRDFMTGRRQRKHQYGTLDI